MPASYVQLEIVANQYEHLIGILSQLGFEGFWEDDASLKCYMKTERWSPAMLDEIHTIAQMVSRSSSSPVPRISMQIIEDQNWNEKWEKTIQPIQVTDRIVISPTWHSYMPSEGQLLLTIDPKMSFGTGYHETTRLVLGLLERHVKPGMRVLDIGTGTGILAIAGVKLGAASAVGIDNDEWSYANAKENIILNDVENQVTIIHGELSSLLHPEMFDMIVANIQRNVIEPLLGEMTQRLVRDGILLLSGLLSADRVPMLAAVRSTGLSILEESAENEWIAIAARK